METYLGQGWAWHTREVILSIADPLLSFPLFLPPAHFYFPSSSSLSDFAVFSCDTRKSSLRQVPWCMWSLAIYWLGHLWECQVPPYRTSQYGRYRWESQEAYGHTHNLPLSLGVEYTGGHVALLSLCVYAVSTVAQHSLLCFPPSQASWGLAQSTVATYTVSPQKFQRKLQTLANSFAVKDFISRLWQGPPQNSSISNGIHGLVTGLIHLPSFPSPSDKQSYLSQLSSLELCSHLLPDWNLEP